MIRRFIAFFLVLISCMVMLPAISVKDREQESNSFDSIPMLEAHYDDTLSDSELSFWENTSISLLTIGKDKPLYSWFGHSALLVETPSSQAMVFDYGTFSFNSEDFFLNFAMGRLWFCCWSTYASYEFRVLEESQRTVSSLPLDMTANQKKAIVNFLVLNSSSEYRTYLYHHYKDNCATRIRDIIDYATGGDFRKWAEAQSGTTYRQQASRSLVQNRFALWALDFLQSGNIDTRNTLWEDMFLPEVLEQGLMEYGKISGERKYLLDFTEDSPYPENSDHSENNMIFSLIFGLCLSLIAVLATKSGKRRLFNIYSSAIYMVFGLCGTLLAFMMFFTDHDVSWNNENLIFINPLLIALSVMCMRRDYGKARVLTGVMLVLTLAEIALKLVLPSVFIQSNWAQILTMLPLYAATFFALSVFVCQAKSAG